MNAPAMIPLQWSGVPHIGEVEEMSSEDRACLAEVRDVLARHQRLHRFGVALLHYHFSMDQDEILVERCDMSNRTLTVQTVSRTQVDPTRLIETIWRFDGVGGTKCQYCEEDEGGNHWPTKCGSEPPTPDTTPPPDSEPPTPDTTEE